MRSFAGLSIAVSAFLTLCPPCAFSQSDAAPAQRATAVPGSTAVTSFDLAQALRARSAWKAVVYDNPVDIAGSGGVDSQSRICFDDGLGAAPRCSYFLSLFAVQGGGDDHFLNLSVGQLAPGVQGVELNAEQSYADGGHGAQTALWVYSQDSNTLTLAFTASLGNDSSGHLIQQGRLAGYYVGVQPGCHKARTEAQTYRITVYRYDASSYKYVQMLDYVTAKEYDPVSDLPDIHLREMPAIEERLAHRSP